MSTASSAKALPEGGSAWAPLAARVFRALCIAQLVSNIGSWMQTVGAQWLLIGHDAALVALVQTASSLPAVARGDPCLRRDRGTRAVRARRRRRLRRSLVARGHERAARNVLFAGEGANLTTTGVVDWVATSSGPADPTRSPWSGRTAATPPC
jgi:hypothetical protein